MKLRAPSRTLLKPIRANEGVKFAYRKALWALLARMHRGMLHAITPVYRELPNIAMDDLQSASESELFELMDEVAKEWRENFVSASKDIAKKFADGSMKATDVAFQSALRDAGFRVKMQVDSAVQSVLDTMIEDNVGLIKSISEDYLAEVREMVRDSVRAGRSMKELSQELGDMVDLDRIGMGRKLGESDDSLLARTQRRANLIARDQNNKATAQIHRARQQQFGITQAQWVHTSASATPRPEHEDWDGETYDIEEGMFSEEDGEFVWPGTPINCLPGDSPVELAYGCNQLWRREFTGELTVLITCSGKTLEATPNHPILTARGWLPIKSVDVGDDVVCVSKQIFNGVETDEERGVTTFAELFETVKSYIVPNLRDSATSLLSDGTQKFQFHGDVSYGEVETINIDRFLTREFDSMFCEKFSELFFPRAEKICIGLGLAPDASLYATALRLFAAPQSIIRSFATLLPLLKGLSGCADDILLRGCSELNACLQESWSNCLSGDVVTRSNLGCAISSEIGQNDEVIRKLFTVLSREAVVWHFEAPTADDISDRGYSEAFANLTHGESGFCELDRVVKKSVRNLASGHVYNLQNEKHWYASQALLYRNCGCTCLSVIPGMDDEDEDDPGEAV